MKLSEIKEELNSVLKGKTLDTILPPLFFVIMNQFFTLSIAAILSLIFVSLLTVYRLLKGMNITYSIFGLIGVGFAAGFAFLMGNVGDYFLPGIIGSGFISVGILVSLIVKRPLPLLLSHLTRGWTLEWFFRKDIYPAYFETGILWFVFFTLRAMFQVFFYATDNVRGLTLMSTVFGFPLTIGILVLTYVYGIYRLKTLKGPGIEEYDQGKKPPFKGQTRGF